MPDQSAGGNRVDAQQCAGGVGEQRLLGAVLALAFDAGTRRGFPRTLGLMRKDWSGAIEWASSIALSREGQGVVCKARHCTVNVTHVMCANTTGYSTEPDLDLVV